VASAIAFDGHAVLVATEQQILTFTPLGKQESARPTGPGVTALASIPSGLLLGHANGSVVLAGTTTAGRQSPEPLLSFRDTFAGAVSLLLAGPAGTIIVGYQSGAFGIWSLNDGQRLYASRLHGAVLHGLVENQRLYLASELGDYRAFDFSTFYQDYCQVMNEVWKAVPITWKNGRPQAQPIPSSHPCAHSTPGATPTRTRRLTETEDETR